MRRLLAATLLCLAAAGPSMAAAPTFSVRVHVTGLAAQAVLQNNGQNDLTLRSNGLATFSAKIPTGQPFNVTVRIHPSFPAQMCAIGNGSGIVSDADVDVFVACQKLTIPRLVATANVHRATLTWNEPSEATGYDLYTSSARDCDVRNYASCPDGALVPNVSSPHEVGGLSNDLPRYFVLQTHYKNKTSGLSEETGARPSGVVFGGFVHALAAAQDKVIVGGAFTAAGIMSGSAVPIERDTGQPILADFPIVSGSVFAIESDPQGAFYLGGNFTAVGGIARANLARILPDGSVDPDFNPGPDDIVRALAYVNGRLYVGGDFTSIGGHARTGLAALTGDGAVASWNPVIGHLHYIYALAGLNDRIFVGGGFPTVNGQARQNLAVFSAVNAATQPGTLLPWKADTDRDVYDLHIANGRLYIGGDFRVVAGQPRVGLAAFGLDSTGNPTALLPLAISLSWVRALAVSGNALYVGHSGPGLHVLDTTTGAHVRSLATTGGDVKSLLTLGGKLYVGGSFTTLGGLPRLNAAAIDPLSNAVLPWNPSPNRYVYALGGSNRTI